jgi:hypothetical protein
VPEWKKKEIIKSIPHLIGEKHVASGGENKVVNKMAKMQKQKVAQKKTMKKRKRNASPSKTK